MKHLDAKLHSKGLSQYIDDLKIIEGTLYGAVFGSPIAHGKIKKLDLKEATKSKGVERILTAKDIPGENQIGSIIQDEPLFADIEVHFIGMPIALVVASSEEEARLACEKIKIVIEPLPIIVDPRVAFEKEELISPSRTFALGDTEEGFKRCKYITQGRADMDGQEHLYLETQGCYIYPKEDGNIKVHSGTQAPRYVQKGISKVLGIPMSQIEVDVIRLGGAFGGKEDQGTPWASMAALASFLLWRPVKLMLHRLDDMKMTGKRHPYSFDYKIGLDENLKIQSFDLTCFQNGGASADVSPAVMERTLFHGSATYFIPNAKITAHSCRTHLPPNTAFRGFGGPQAFFAVEAAIADAAKAIGIPAYQIQQNNLLKEGDSFPYGQIATRCKAQESWDLTFDKYNVEKVEKETIAFNSTNDFVKKGFSLQPICFGISFTKTSLNQGRALVHVYVDGSITVTTGVIEMGQAVNTKIVQVAAATLKVDGKRIRIESTNTTRIANASPTAASSGADLNGNATRLACEAIYNRLIAVAATHLSIEKSLVSIKDEWIHIDDVKSDLHWNQLISLADESRVCLSEHGHYTTPTIHFDKTKEKGSPFAYHVYGTALTTVTLDCIRGTYSIDEVRIVHDFGTSINLPIDLGQIEGALAQGIGLMTMEELKIFDDGRIFNTSLASYKVPDIYSAASVVEVTPLETEADPLAIFGSKAVGEPPLIYGIGAFYAIKNAAHAFNPNNTLANWSPLTPQKCLEGLYPLQ